MGDGFGRFSDSRETDLSSVFLSLLSSVCIHGLLLYSVGYSLLLVFILTQFIHAIDLASGNLLKVVPVFFGHHSLCT